MRSFGWLGALEWHRGSWKGPRCLVLRTSWAGLGVGLCSKGSVLSLEKEIAVGFDKVFLTSWALKDQGSTVSIVAEAAYDLVFLDPRNRQAATDDRDQLRSGSMKQAAGGPSALASARCDFVARLCNELLGAAPKNTQAVTEAAQTKLLSLCIKRNF